MLSQSKSLAEQPVAAAAASKPPKATRKRKQPTSTATISTGQAEVVAPSQPQSGQALGNEAGDGNEGGEGGGDSLMELAAIIEQEARDRQVS